MIRPLRWLIALFTRTRFCEDCRWYRMGIPFDLCTHDESGEDRAEYLVRRGVAKQAKPYACTLMRRGACGRAGKLWRPK